MLLYAISLFLAYIAVGVGISYLYCRLTIPAEARECLSQAQIAKPFHHANEGEWVKVQGRLALAPVRAGDGGPYRHHQESAAPLVAPLSQREAVFVELRAEEEEAPGRRRALSSKKRAVPFWVSAAEGEQVLVEPLRRVMREAGPSQARSRWGQAVGQAVDAFLGLAPAPADGPRRRVFETSLPVGEQRFFLGTRRHTPSGPALDVFGVFRSEEEVRARGRVSWGRVFGYFGISSSLCVPYLLLHIFSSLIAGY